VKAQLSGHDPNKRRKRRRSGRSWEALDVPESVTASLPVEEEGYDDALDKELLRASQQEYLFVGIIPQPTASSHADRTQGSTMTN
jgi:hypothetical protein